MKILLTGDKGFVGRNIRKALSDEGHTIVGLEVTPSFDKWLDKFKYPDVRLEDLDAVIHAGAIATNQYTDPSIFLWNSYATLMLAKYARDRYGSEVPFIFFSTFQVDVVESKPNSASWYGWSKKYAEDCLKEVLPHATILRPGVMWGDERYKGNLKDSSVPYLLATHQLEFLYKHWGRDYIHVSDVVEAVKIALHEGPAGTFNLTGEYWWNENLAKLTDWQGYDLIDNHARSMKLKFNSEIVPEDSEGLPLLPSWERQSTLEFEFGRLEAQYASHTG